MPHVNMKVISNGFKPKVNQLEPTIEITLLIELPPKRIVCNEFKGELWLGTKRLCQLSEPIPSFLQKGHSLKGENATDSYDVSYNAYLEGILSTKALEFIEQERMKNSKGDIPFRIKLEAKYFESYHKFIPTNHSYGPSHGGPHPGFALDDGASLFALGAKSEEIRHTIHQSTWIYDFLPAFEMGKYIVIEVPTIDTTLLSGDIKKRIDGAFEAIELMEKAKARGDWNEVIKESRPLWELSRNQVIVRETLLAAGFTETVITNFLGILKAAFDYSAKFIHKVSNDGTKTIMPTIPAHKEDALFIYSMAVNVISVLAQKMNRQKKS